MMQMLYYKQASLTLQFLYCMETCRLGWVLKHGFLYKTMIADDDVFSCIFNPKGGCTN